MVADNEWHIVDTIKRLLLQVPDVQPLSAHGDPRMSVVIGIPMERTMMQEAFFGFAQVIQQGWGLAQLPYTRNDMARHQMCQFLLESEYSHLVMLDSDHIHPRDVVQRLARWFIAYPDQVRVVGGLNFRRGAPYDPCAFVDPGDGINHRMANWGQGAIEVDALGTGSMMIARDVLEEMPEAEGWWDYQYVNHRNWGGTDMTFSARCKAHGITLWCDTTTTSPHLGTMLIDEATYRAFLNEKLAQEAQRLQPETVVIPEGVTV